MAEAGNAGGLLKDLAPVCAFHGKNFIDFTLADDGVALPAKTGVHKQLVDVLEAHRAAVEIVFAFSGAVIPPGDHDLGLLHGKKAAGIVQHQGNLRIALLPALFGAAENHVFHFAAPQRAGGLLAHNPADGVGNVGLSAAVGAYDGRNVLAEGKDRFIGEGFKALYFQSL
ncbi:hypothetical protein SDC9_138885 [bioreactor metagenome]|uniref:Uncharacterized protein n=1 Tax=bioreactor metagenome TaxID=1076179 RepID=A0A645DR24_9ZZZZ